MINALRVLAWAIILAGALLAGIAGLVYVYHNGLDQRAVVGALAGVIAFAMAVWFWLSQE